MTDSRIWVLGAPDPEMEMTEGLLRECGETVVYATTGDGERVTAATAYRCPVPEAPEGATVYAVECIDVLPDGWVRIDHHRPGDPGYGRPPSEFLAASSIGQVIAELARVGRLPGSWDREFGPEGLGLGEFFFAPDGDPSAAPDWFVVSAVHADGSDDGGEPDFDSTDLARIPHDLVLTAAADHCLGAAYRGECPGVDPDALMRWRADSRARFQGRAVEEVLADVERAQAALLAAPELVLLEDPCSDIVVRDMRQPVDQQPTRELPEAATRLGIGYVSGPLVGPDGRQKITCSGSASQVRAFLDHWAPSQGLVDAYGDPERGFAGAYLPEEVAS